VPPVITAVLIAFPSDVLCRDGNAMIKLSKIAITVGALLLRSAQFGTKQSEVDKYLNFRIIVRNRVARQA
jgi:hypothetical protein